ncbi:hypothetical protein K701_28025 [Streptomyces fradiae ATCC 10745 = DSM 40063]|uniref:Uncharacterized protein n=1 Tax=Streptomyces fradiae ATCC 10745 = DSM 40063 TaxID=1319510 RepID=A0ABQ6XLF2_STRFR|nr:hypothetical protein K701_28025 [Streptomyces fradiae ATCC 10745 = DSM 40063]
MVDVVAVVGDAGVGVAFGAESAAAGFGVGQLALALAAPDAGGQAGRRCGEGLLLRVGHVPSLAEGVAV